MSQIEIKHLQLIKSIAETENLTRAARQLNISQPALSRRLLDIEERLGASLFLRSKKRMILTAEGRRMLKSADTILNELELTELDISKIVNGESGVLRIGVSCMFCFQWLPDVLIHFQQYYPKVDLSISVCNNADRDLWEKTFDIVITALPLNSKKIDTVDLFTDELMVILAPDHPFNIRRRIGHKEISNAKLITNMSLPTIEDFIQILWSGPKVAPKAVMHVEHPYAVIELVKAGLGISIVPRWAVSSYLKEKTLSALPIGDNGIHPTWKAAYSKGRGLPAFQKKFIDLILKLNF